MSSKGLKTLVVGYGNILRGDDGAGPSVARRLDEEHLPGVIIRTLHQLAPELLDEAVDYPRVLFIDASDRGDEVKIEKISSSGIQNASSTHHFSPQLFCRMARQVYQHDLNLYLCSIRGEHFDLGEGLSPQVEARCEQALTLIRDFLTKD